MATASLSRIDRSIDIDAPPGRVWRALTNCRRALGLVPGADRGEHCAWHRGVDDFSPHGHEGQRFRVRFTEMVEPHRFAWEWHPGAVDPNVDYSREPRTTVTFTLEPSERGTRLTVSETGFDAISLARRAKVYEDNSQGWPEVLVWLQQHVEKAG